MNSGSLQRSWRQAFGARLPGSATAAQTFAVLDLLAFPILIGSLAWFTFATNTAVAFTALFAILPVVFFQLRKASTSRSSGGTRGEPQAERLGVPCSGSLLNHYWRFSRTRFSLLTVIPWLALKVLVVFAAGGSLDVFVGLKFGQAEAELETSLWMLLACTLALLLVSIAKLTSYRAVQTPYAILFLLLGVPAFVLAFAFIVGYGSAAAIPLGLALLAVPWLALRSASSRSKDMLPLFTT